MDLNTFIVGAVFCFIDDRIAELGRLRARGDPLQRSATPKCSPHRGRRRVSGTRRRRRTLCVLSASLRPFLPENLLRVHRTTFAAGQAANPWKAKEHLWQKLLAENPTVPASPWRTLFPCRRVCSPEPTALPRRFEGEAAFGKDTLLKQTFYGFRVHVRVCWPGVITRISVAPADAHELSVLPDLVEHAWGVVVGDRNYCSPPVREELAGRGVELAASYRTKKRETNPERSAFLSHLRYRIDAVFSQLTERYSVKRGYGRASCGT
jgi:hypothetical protein